MGLDQRTARQGRSPSNDVSLTQLRDCATSATDPLNIATDTTPQNHSQSDRENQSRITHSYHHLTPTRGHA